MPDTPKIQFTPAQAAAIGARGGSLLVSAAAGSGKTRVLVERVVGMITDPQHPVEADSLLIMTFTNAAAAKLRADIATRLADEVRAHPGNVRLRRQQLLLQRASIGTVDAFCLHFVQQHFAALDVPPDFETAEEADLARIEQEVLADLLEEAYEDPDFRAFADLYDRGRTDQTAGNAVLELYHFSRSLPHPMQALQSFADQWQNGEPPQTTPWGKDLLRIALDRARGAQALLEAGARTAARDEAADAAYTAVLQDDVSRVEWLCQKLQQGDWDAAVAALEELGGSWRKAGRIKGGKDSNPVAFAASELRDRAKKQIAALRTDFLLCTAEEYQEDRRRAAPLVAALVRITQRFADACFAAKCEEKLLDYADFEHLTLDLLIAPDGSRTPLCHTVSERYSAVLVDEYQDTNALQDAIYFALASPEADNLFFVGDIKQSIYRFRQADPAVFLGKQQCWQPYPQPAPQPATLALDANFRSAPQVIEGINYLFSVFFSEGLGGVTYGDGQRLVVGKPDVSYPGLCEVDVLDGADAAGDAAGIAQRIAGMMQEGFAVRDKTGTRPCRYDDFCILLRGRADFSIYEEALRAAEIPVFADTAADLLDAPHIRPFAALLRVIDNPAQDIPLAAVLLSPMFPYTPDDLVSLRRACPQGSLYGAVLYGGQPRFAAFTESLAEYRRLARTLPVDRLLEELLARTGYLAAVGALPDGARCREDLLTFVTWAGGAGRAGLSALVRAMDSAAANGGLNQSGGGQTRPGCVSIMTVHRSKGLEFPVVFVANTAHQFNQSDAIRPVLTHSRLGVGVMLRAGKSAKRYKTLPYAALAQAIRTETLSEEMRVLYVALTRAQDALIVTIPLKKTDSALKTPALCAAAEATGPEAMQGMSSWAGWLLTAVLLHPESDALWAHTPLLPHHLPTKVPLTVRLLPAPEAMPEQPPCLEVQPDVSLRRALEETFAWHNPREKLQKIPAKVSVSAVTHGARPVALERPAFLQKSGMTGAERGTAIHAFLQSVPFDGPAPDLQAEVQRQKDLRLLDADLAEKLDLERVRPFFESGVWRRIRAARRVLREEPFITALPASQVAPEAGQSDAEVLVQGIADLVLVFDDHAEICDYKTDASREPEFYKKEYAAQLQLYRHAFALRLGVPVTKLTIYSFTLQQEIDIPLREG
ncbi:UvrD-helicase domain-containing protein [Subdoligranulum variabile]|uniref:DNA 3'-5' helicase n=1 Tax=Subdoligranulum variabile DSM 15176 TaxID=411471 RepID=D1PLS3_9FIRM|nr:UvrD-helicase domain-containing protein [Subdoligranulum variabile]EFB76371.1 putative ATP-dependent nuclease subunit A [Subdoligranulum variabile DSM 15176]UWP67888.1 UvrD-helicase domain-containing protein [Subdoligranulum variabile]